MKKRHWSDNDRQLGPFTFSRDKRYQPIELVLDSGHGESPGCHLRMSCFGLTLITELPSIIEPHRKKVIPGWDEATIARLGRDYYYDEHSRKYGFYVNEGFLQVLLGPQTMDSSTTKSWSTFLPWTQWRFIRHSLYDINGRHFWTWPKSVRKDIRDYIDQKDNCPSVTFEFDDFDGERINARTMIEEREWHFGEGWFKWLSLFRKPMIRRSLYIAFSKETGPKKGSWKGGTTGHSIDMLPGELHESAFRRYCPENQMTFIG